MIAGSAAHWRAVSAARSRAATMTNLARSSLALVLLPPGSSVAFLGRESDHVEPAKMGAL